MARCPASFAALLAACSFQPGQPAQQAGGSAVPDAPVKLVDARAIDAPAVIQHDAAIDAPPVATIPRDCLDAYQHGVTTDGVVTIDPDGTGGAAPFAAYCDMTTSGGGWTLAWVYGFSSYNQFTSSGNAVTPRPTWGLPQNNGTSTSTTPPAGPTTPGAIEFAKWQSLGANLLVKSNINHWITCAPGTGSVVTKTNGTMTCSIVQLVATACTTVVPTQVMTDTVSVGLYASTNPYSTYYYWDGSTQYNWPTHDPCGSNQTNQVTGVASPYGAVYLRR